MRNQTTLATFLLTVLMFLGAATGRGALAADASAPKAESLAPFILGQTQKQMWEQPMKLALVRSNEKGCEPICAEWVMAEGQITPDTPALFRKVLADMGQKRLPVILRSPGGNILAAIEIGYLLRAKGVDTAVGTTSVDGCSPWRKGCTPKNPDGFYRGRVVTRESYCFSACPLILAGGAQRLASAASLVGVHQWSFELTEKDKKEAKAAGRKLPDRNNDLGWNGIVEKMITDYLSTMKVSGNLIGEMRKAPFTSIHMLNMKRRTALGLITARDNPSAFATCAEFPPRINCISSAEVSVSGNGLSRSYRDGLAIAGIMPPVKEMTVTVVRHSSAGCEPHCPQWIAAEGVITPQTPKQFRAVLKRIGTSKLPVLLTSPGGDLDAALEIGAMIAKSGLDVIVSGTAYFGCRPEQRDCKAAKARKFTYRGFPFSSKRQCGGVCVFVLAAGRQRAVGDGVAVIHAPDIYFSRSKSTGTLKLVQDYAARTGTSAELLFALHSASGTTPKTLDTGALMRMFLVTSTASAEDMLNPAQCTAAPAPAFCIKRK